MEVPKEVYTEFYKDRRRQKYLMEQSANNGDFSYDMLTTEEFNGADILLDSKADVEEQVEKKIMLDKLLEAIYLLSDDEVDLIKALFYDGLTEREYARKRGIYHNAVHKQKGRILAKLKKFLEI